MVVHGANELIDLGRARWPFAIAYAFPRGIIPAPAPKKLFRPAGNKPTTARVLLQMEASAPNVPSTFEHLMLPHLDAAYNLARWLLRHEHDAEDAVQDACLRAHQAFGRFRGGDGRAWLLSIVRNVCYSRLRTQRRGPAAEAFDDEAHGSTEDPAEANATIWRETKSALLRQALEQLPAEFREVIVLHELEGLAYREIATIAEIPIGTVMSRLARARHKLQAALLALAQKESTHGL
jgi:RNA polymerase sigma-70 factor, ECF subfamily